jgi:hypothetical protein
MPALQRGARLSVWLAQLPYSLAMRPESAILTGSHKFPQISTEYESDMWDLSTSRHQAMVALAEWRLKCSCASQ